MPKRTDTKEKIETAAIKLIAASGVDAVAMRDIAAEVGVSEAAIYRHYKNKEALVWEIFKANYETLAQRLDEQQASHQSLRGKIDAMVQACAHLFDTDRNRFVFILLAQHIQKIAPDDYVPGLSLLLVNILDEAVKQNEIPAQDVDVTASMLMGIVLQTALYCLYHKPQQLNLTPLAPVISASCWQVAIRSNSEDENPHYER